MERQQFDKALLKAVDLAFNSLGKSCQHAIYFHLEATFHISRSQIPSKLVEFDEALISIFGIGTQFLERLILRELCEILKTEFDENRTLNFVDAVFEIRNIVSEKETIMAAIADFNETATTRSGRGGGRSEAKSQRACGG